MRNFRLTPIVVALVGVLAVLPSAQSEVAEIPSQGDLDIYTAGNIGSGNAILLMIDTSSLGGIGQNERIEVMRQAIIKLMDNPTAFPVGTKVGVGMYPATTVGDGFGQADGLTGGIYIPISELTPEHREKIKAFVGKIKYGVDESPMASAYAEAGAYMLGTKTSRLTYAPDATPPAQGELTEEQQAALPMSRALRVNRDKDWQYCPPESRKQVIYTTLQGTKIRNECADEDWKNINKKNIASENWSGTAGLDQDEPTEREIKKVEKNGQREYDLMWSGSGPHGRYSKASNKRISPKHLLLTGYSFIKDDFQKSNPTTSDLDGEEDEWEYLIDHTLLPDKTLVPVLRYRALRSKYVGRNHKENGKKTAPRIWQYCPKDKAELVDYIYSSYRLMCNEKDWVNIAVYDTNGKVNKAKTDVRAKSLGLRWNHGFFPNITRGGRPHGITGKHKEDGQSWQYFYDPILNPYNGWAYYYDLAYTSQEYPPLPPTLNVGYSISGIRNSPPEVRSFQGYGYDQPNYKLCPAVDGKVQSNPDNRSSSAAAGTAVIYFLTAGEPRSAGVQPLNEMNMSLTEAGENDINVTNAAGPITSNNCKAAISGLDNSFRGTDNRMNSHWGCMGEYSKRLRDLDNPAKKDIKTGVFLVSSNSTNQVTDTASCTATKTTYKNACLLGDSAHGGGGFYEVLAPLSGTEGMDAAIDRQAKKLADAMASATDKLESNDSGPIPTGQLVVPRDDFTSDALHDYGYLPLMSPKPDSKVAQWQGNLRKYKQVNGAYVDKDNNSPYSSTAEAILSATSRDYWSTQSAYDASALKGGAFEKIPMPTSATTDTPRHVYLSESSAGKLTELSPDADEIKKVEVEGVSDNTTLRRLLLNYMGYTIGNYSDSTTTTEIIDTYSSGSNKSLGGVFHSTPILLTSRLDLQNNEYVPKKQFILFGAMDNAVHIVNDKTGKEVLSYFPREVLATNGQYKAITPELTAEGDEMTPAFGVDGPWTSYSRYDKPDSHDHYRVLEAKQLYAYGGARLGAKAYYGLDLTYLHRVGFEPKQLFTITPTSDNKFNRLGYSWAKPVVTKIRWQGKPKLVVILSGGYDTYFDKTDGERKEEYDGGDKDPMNEGTTGNAIYVVDAKTGEPLIVASNKAANVGISSASNSDNAMVNDPNNTAAGTFNGADATIPVLNSHLKYSITGSVKVLDRDADELTDHIYFADLNGQVFRMDINNGASTIPSGSATEGKNPSVRVARLADLALDSSSPIGPRFYEAPVVTIQKNNEGERFAVVSVASGDRSNPLWTPSDSANNNYVFAIYDKDVANVGLFDTALTTVDVTATDLVTSPVSATLSNYAAAGWKVPLDKFTLNKEVDGSQVPPITNDTEGKAIKALGPMSAVGNKLYIAAYNPNDGRSDESNCKAEIKGSSEALQFCLPYGYCNSSKGADDQYQRIKIGSGVMGIAFGGAGDDNRGRTILTSSSSTKDEDDDGNVVITPDDNQDLNNSAESFKKSYTFKPRLTPMGWFDLQSQHFGTTSSVDDDGS